MNDETVTRPPPTRGRTLDHAAGLYDILAPVMTLGLERDYRRRAMKALELTSGNKVLDIGCGTGTLTIDIADKIKTDDKAMVTGIDAAPKMIDRARNKISSRTNVEFTTAVAERLPFADNSFDRAVSTFFFHHIDYDLKLRSLNELWHVLRKGGIVVIVDVTVPTNLFGKLCAWSGYLLFQQDEIRENIEGKLTEAFDSSLFGRYEHISHHAGHISIFRLRKP